MQNMRGAIYRRIYMSNSTSVSLREAWGVQWLLCVLRAVCGGTIQFTV